MGSNEEWVCKRSCLYMIHFHVNINQMTTQKKYFPHMLKKLEYVGRLDIIWDRYLPQSLKQATIQGCPKKFARIRGTVHCCLTI